MNKYIFGAYQTEVDCNATKAWYKTSSTWNCECAYCRNFLKAVKENQLPEEVLNELNTLGIPPEKATYVCEIYPKDNRFVYQFSYRIVGNILCDTPQEQTKSSWGEMRCCHEPYPHGAPDFPNPHFDLEFWVDLPWLLDEDYAQ